LAKCGGTSSKTGQDLRSTGLTTGVVWVRGCTVSKSDDVWTESYAPRVTVALSLFVQSDEEVSPKEWGDLADSCGITGADSSSQRVRYS
jgi:hypothetical protein